MSMLTQEEKNRLFMTLDAQTEQLNKLNRGMYGDPQNNVKGIIDRVAHIESWITASKLKMAYLSGAVAAITVGLKMLWDWIVDRIAKK